MPQQLECHGDHSSSWQATGRRQQPAGSKHQAPRSKQQAASTATASSRHHAASSGHHHTRHTRGSGSRQQAAGRKQKATSVTRGKRQQATSSKQQATSKLGTTTPHFGPSWLGMVVGYTSLRVSSAVTQTPLLARLPCNWAFCQGLSHQQNKTQAGSAAGIASVKQSTAPTAQRFMPFPHKLQQSRSDRAPDAMAAARGKCEDKAVGTAGHGAG